MVNREKLRIGDTVSLPVYPEKNPITGTVIYISRNRLWSMVEFITDSGNRIKECYPLYGNMIPQ